MQHPRVLLSSLLLIVIFFNFVYGNHFHGSAIQRTTIIEAEEEVIYIDINTPNSGHIHVVGTGSTTVVIDGRGMFQKRFLRSEEMPVQYPLITPLGVFDVINASVSTTSVGVLQVVLDPDYRYELTVDGTSAVTEIYGGPGDDLFAVLSTNHELRIFGAEGNDIVTSRDCSRVLGNLVFHGEDGEFDEIDLSNVGDFPLEVASLSNNGWIGRSNTDTEDNTFTGLLGSGDVLLDGVEAAEIELGNAGDKLTIDGMPSTFFLVDAGDGVDTITITGVTNEFVLEAGPGDDRVRFASGREGLLEVNLGPGGDTLWLEALDSGELLVTGDDGSDVIVLGKDGRLGDALKGAITLDMGPSDLDVLLVDDSANPQGSVLAVDYDTILLQDAVSSLKFANVEVLEFHMTDFDDEFTVGSRGAATATFLFLGAGNDFVYVEGTAPTFGVSVLCGDGDDVVLVTSQIGDFGMIRGKLAVVGQSGDDQILIHDVNNPAGRSWTAGPEAVNDLVFWDASLEQVMVLGGNGSDVFQAQPSTNTIIDLRGAEPNLGFSGDVINIEPSLLSPFLNHDDDDDDCSDAYLPNGEVRPAGFSCVRWFCMEQLGAYGGPLSFGSSVVDALEPAQTDFSDFMHTFTRKPRRVPK